MSDGKPSVLLLGSYHMANRGLDRFNLGADDVRTDRRQQEIGQVVDRLLHFQPRKVAVEVLPSCGDTLNAEYEAYRTGRFDLPRDEVYQLGFRVAERSGHSHLHPINAMVSRDVDPFQWANEHGQLDLVEQMTHSWQALVNEEEACLAQRSVQEVLRRLNAPDRGKQVPPAGAYRSR